MTNFIALYRGESVATAKLIAVSSEREVVGRFLRELAGERSAEDFDVEERNGREPLTVIQGDGE